mmetsp:Transcript_126212/g.188335  ORF Transcript_126212/g.188335 Transcript_126212/m.188335 type:complete len:144 (+) Transcript_126212:316-747(+)
MHHTSLIGKLAIRPHQRLSSHGLSKHFDAQHVGDDFFRLTIGIGMDQGNVIVGRNDISKGTESFFDALNDDLFGYGIAQVLQFLIGRRVGDQESANVPYGRSSDEAATGDGRMQDGDMVTQFGLQDGIKVFRAANAGEAIRIC